MNAAVPSRNVFRILRKAGNCVLIPKDTILGVTSNNYEYGTFLYILLCKNCVLLDIDCINITHIKQHWMEKYILFTRKTVTQFLYLSRINSENTTSFYLAVEHGYFICRISGSSP